MPTNEADHTEADGVDQKAEVNPNGADTQKVNPGNMQEVIQRDTQKKEAQVGARTEVTKNLAQTHKELLVVNGATI